MPHSRKRPGHHEHREPSVIPAKQRTKGRTLWAILLAIFALVLAFFAGGPNYPVLIIGAIVGALVGYIIGKNMEKDASHK